MKRREFMRISAGLTGTTLACLLLPSTEVGAAEAVPGSAWSVAARLHLLPDGSALVRVEKSEMGQGVTTALPMLIAEELELPWNAVRIELASADHAFRDARGNQSTGYSSSVSSSFIPLRTLGAAARQMLEAAAATQWGLAPDQVGARSGRVIDLAHPDRSLSYAELLDAARRIAPPASPRLKQPADYTVIGRPISRSDTPGKVDGSTRFGIDIAWPGLRIAMIERAPHPAAVLLGCDEAAALAVPGVERVLQLPRGIALVGRDTWSVRRGRAALAARWTALTDDSGDTPRHRARLDAALAQPGRIARNEGDIDQLRREPPAGHAFLEIDRVQFREQLSRLDHIPLVDQHPRHAARQRRAQGVAAPGLHRADAEGARHQRTLLHRRDRDPGRRERPLVRHQPAEQHRNPDAGGNERRLAAETQVHVGLRPWYPCSSSGNSCRARRVMPASSPTSADCMTRP